MKVGDELMMTTDRRAKYQATRRHEIAGIVDSLSENARRFLFYNSTIIDLYCRRKNYGSNFISDDFLAM